MSAVESELRQTILLPTERHDFDNNAMSVTPHTSGNERTSNSDSKRSIRKSTIIMMNICKEIILMVIVAFTYAALTNDSPKSSKIPTAYPFFPKGSVVKDWYKGEISAAIEKARQSDIAFVMFYAPWDAESQEVRWQFELTARHMRKLVTFAAVNCWQPDSECRNQYSKVYNWPVLIAYPTHGRGIQYNGPKTVTYMMKFLNCVMMPLKRVNGLEVHYLRQSYDAVILANMNSHPRSNDYAVIYSTALRFLEKDPFQEIAFAVNTQYKNSKKELSIYTWNKTVLYTEDEWKPDSVLNWIYKNVQQVTMWVSPTGSKSQQLSYYIQPGPALILFTPRNPLLNSNDYYDLLHEVGLEYYYCKNNTNNLATYLLSLGIHNHRISNYVNFKQPCSMSQEKSPKNAKQKRLHSVTYDPNMWLNNSFCTSSNDKKYFCDNYDLIQAVESKLAFEGGILNNIEKAKKMYDEVLNTQIYEDNMRSKQEHTVGNYKNVYKTSMLTGNNDPKSPKNLVKTWKQLNCKMSSIAVKHHPPLFTESIINGISKSSYYDISGFACKSNRSLTLVAMDSLKYHHFAETLGVDVLNLMDRSAAVILNEKMEIHHVLNGAVNDNSLREFIYNFTKNNLSRALYSSSKKYNYTHVYSENEDCNNKTICIKELNSESFVPTVMQMNKALVVLYYSKQCSFCPGVSYKFLKVAKMFTLVSSLQFARIDGDLNTLPWEFSMDTYPTILYFPTTRKSESRAFPKSVPVTLPNLITFILSNLNPSLKLHAMWSLCIKMNDDYNSCISSVRIESLSLINRTLKEWRKADSRRKPEILDKLRHLKSLHLCLAHSPKDIVSIQKYMKKLHLKRKSQVSNSKEIKYLKSEV